MILLQTNKMGVISPRPLSPAAVYNVFQCSKQLQRFTSYRSYSSSPNYAPSNKARFVPSSGTYPLGFKVAGSHVGVKPSNKSSPDLALISSSAPCSAAAVFTKNKFQAAPVAVSRDVLASRGGEGLRSIVINAGCANAVTGKGGLNDARSMAHAVDSCVQAADTAADPSGHSSTLVMSTGVIGQRLPIQRILGGIPHAHASLSDSHNAYLDAARAICTTDTFPKLLSITFTLPSAPGREYRLAGMAKGAGMIHPNMATLLGVLLTDAPVAAAALQPLLTHAVDRSFHCISVDGDTSTNDTVALLANHAAGGPTLADPQDPAFAALQEVVTGFAQTLSQLVVRDGEGATKFVRVRVTAAASYQAARAVAASIARSPLVKTALYGRDANWGRILCAVGYAPDVPDGAVVPERTSVAFVPPASNAGQKGEQLKLLVNGEPENVDEERAAEMLKEEDLEIRVELGTGTHEASYWFCDFSHEYVTSKLSPDHERARKSANVIHSQW